VLIGSQKLVCNS